MLTFNTEIPIVKIPINADVELFIKREDLVHPSISGNKFWKLYYNIIQYLELKKKSPLIITFGGAFSNHIAAVSALGKELNIPTIGIIRGEELQESTSQNPTLYQAQQNGMQLRFVTREDYRNQSKLTQLLQLEFPDALIIPEGGSNNDAVNGIQFMLSEQTKDFDYLCCAVGTGGTISGLSKFAEQHQKVIGIKVVKDDSLEKLITNWSQKDNFSLKEAFQAKYGKITEDNIRFINQFYQDYNIPLDPIYTGKMMEKLLALIDENYFKKGSRILAFHTGGLQGISGANDWLKKKNKLLIEF
ncbi:1-aminocyclopropane-1-carboxylate deaminase/D-cysteine desulfhydrase [Chryseobacterium sp. T1]